MLGFSLLGSSPVVAKDANTPADVVNPFIGASTSTEKAGVLHGLGKTFPGATTPFGMVQVNPNTITGGDNGPGYSYEMEHIEGFAFTQMSGIGWYGDLGNFLVTPTTGELQLVAGRHPEVAEGWLLCRHIDGLWHPGRGDCCSPQRHPAIHFSTE